MSLEQLRFEKYNQRNILEKKYEINKFLKGLGNEKHTLFGGYQKGQYPEDVDWIVDNTITAILAYDENEIIGLAGIRQNLGKGLSKNFPIVRGYTVVKESYQGRGIGSELTRRRDESMKNIRAFHLSIILKDNEPMIKIVEKSGYFRIKETDDYVYHIKTFNQVLSPFTSLIIMIFRILLFIRSMDANAIL